MRIMMLGWEFPPFIAGGLGTACYGLTKAMDRLGHEVTFVLPRPVDRSRASHITLLTPETPPGPASPLPPLQAGVAPGARPDSASAGDGSRTGATRGTSAPYTMPGFEHTTFYGVSSGFSSPYPPFSGKREASNASGLSEIRGGPDGAEMNWDRVAEVEAFRAAGVHVPDHEPAAYDQRAAGGSGGSGPGGGGAHYGSDILGDAERYARLVVGLGRREKFDVIHAHDWLTYPAGLALARVTGKPLVVHVHSTEFDRSGEHVNQRIYDIERRGMHGALRVIAVSELTRSICLARYGLAPSKVDVVYNGIENEAAQPPPGGQIAPRDRIVLFLGRLTMQKGPEYFIAAARRVLELIDDVKFVVAGSGDMDRRMIELAAEMGIGHKVLFTGFLRGRDVDRVFRMADCYVMPSVSEPFGLAALEAIHNGVPVIISKQSGVSEVLTHALKVDFWDVDEMANKIVAVLRHPPLSQTLRHHGAFELRRLTWDGAAERCVSVYRAAMGSQHQMMG